MWYRPFAFSVGIRDVIGAWLVCLVIAAACFSLPAVTATLEGGGSLAGLINPDRVDAVAAFIAAHGRP